MTRRARRLLRNLAILVVVLGFAYWWVLGDPGKADGRWSIDVGELRRLANAIPGQKPGEIRVETLHRFGLPALLVRAGTGFAKQPMAVFSYQLVFPDRTIIVDGGIDEESTRDMPGFESLDPEAFRRLRRALELAETSVITHEHPDHFGLLLVHPNPEVLARATITAAQVRDPSLSEPLEHPPALASKKLLDYERVHALAPGVVLVATPGHTPGSQIVYVQLADGREVLLLGDVAWMDANITMVQERPRFATWMIGEDRQAVLQQLATLRDLRAEEPGIAQVPGHDRTVVEALVERGVLVPGFVVP